MERRDAWNEPFQLTVNFLPSLLLGFLVESLLYGMHAILFFICVYILVRRRRRRKLQMAMLGAIVVTFILATADIAVSWSITLRHTTSLYTGDSAALLHRLYPKFLFFIVNNLIADVLLVLRCYVVWDRKKIILLPSCFVLVVGTVFGVMGEGTLSGSLKMFIGVYILITIFFNLFLTLLTAGRIYWIARQIKSILDRETTSQYHFAIAIVIESGLIYSLASVLVLALSRTRFIVMAAALAIRIVCITPILIIVQITLGQSTNLKEAIIKDSAHQTAEYSDRERHGRPPGFVCR
ncbi:hypothetical protein BYT27DRAFT_6446554 [Phlegmacium glaucopus]|nr:hypothetical protein BYT27DRAFT_6446554 [Phlegmacium glaucopus]